MLAGLIEFSLRQRALVLIAACVLAVAGAWAYLKLPIDAFPDISPTQVKVILKIPGMTPEEVEQRVSTPIEQELLGIPHKTIVRSVSKYGISDVTVDFEEGVDELLGPPAGSSERLSRLMRDLPPNAIGGWRRSPRRWARCSCSRVEGDGFSLAERRRVLDWVIRPACARCLAWPTSMRWAARCAATKSSPTRRGCAPAPVTLEQLRQALDANNRNDGAGRVEQGDENWVVRVEGGVRGRGRLAARSSSMRPARAMACRW
ncbi:efflux RND transporter permease subunit [Cupriavidus basilensis]